jgi:hypothetical protein
VRTVALSGSDGSVDWWCVPNLDSPPLFDRLLDPDEGGHCAITPTEPFAAEQRYRPDSNPGATHARPAASSRRAFACSWTGRLDGSLDGHASVNSSLSAHRRRAASGSIA